MEEDSYTLGSFFFSKDKVFKKSLSLVLVTPYQKWYITHMHARTHTHTHTLKNNHYLHRLYHLLFLMDLNHYHLDHHISLALWVENGKFHKTNLWDKNNLASNSYRSNMHIKHLSLVRKIHAVDLKMTNFYCPTN